MSGKTKQHAARRAVRCPQKRSINLNMREKRSGALLKLLTLSVCILLLAACVAKFGVYDRYEKLSEAERAYASVHQEYERMREELADYERVLAEYRTYSPDAALGAEVVDRLAVLDLVEKEMMPHGSVSAIQVYGSVVSVQMSGMDLVQIAEMLEAIEAYEVVSQVELKTAETEWDKPASSLSFYVDITLREEAVE